MVKKQFSNKKINSLLYKNINQEIKINPSSTKSKRRSRKKKKNIKDYNYPDYDNILDSSEIQILETYSNPNFHSP